MVWLEWQESHSRSPSESIPDICINKCINKREIDPSLSLRGGGRDRFEPMSRSAEQLEINTHIFEQKSTIEDEQQREDEVLHAQRQRKDVDVRRGARYQRQQKIRKQQADHERRAEHQPHSDNIIEQAEKLLAGGCTEERQEA